MVVHRPGVTLTHRAEPAATRLPVLGSVLVVAALSVGLWRLAGMPPFAWVRVLADGAAICVLGLAAMPYLVDGPRRAALQDRAARPLRAAAMLWFTAEVGRVLLAAAEAIGIAANHIPHAMVWVYLSRTQAGRAGLVAVAIAVIAVVIVLVSVRTWHVAVVSALGLAAGGLSGHVADTVVGMVVIAAHAVTAGLWCGVMIAMSCTVRCRQEWAELLPRFSRLALTCVAVLLASGAWGAWSALEGWRDLLSAPYGRVLLVKVGLAVVLVGLGWHHRTRWVVAAGTQSARRSHRRAVVEAAVMGVALVGAVMLTLAG